MLRQKVFYSSQGEQSLGDFFGYIIDMVFEVKLGVEKHTQVLYSRYRIRRENLGQFNNIFTVILANIIVVDENIDWGGDTLAEEISKNLVLSGCNDNLWSLK
jgi:hypothetical protein